MDSLLFARMWLLSIVVVDSCIVHIYMYLQVTFGRVYSCCTVSNDIPIGINKLLMLLCFVLIVNSMNCSPSHGISVNCHSN